MRWFIKLAYDGAPYHGWQSQPNAVSVQQVLEEALATVLRRPVAITGAGRTDTGVNARCMYAHFDADLDEASLPALVRSLNRLTGPSIAVESIRPVAPDAHARFDATSRTYKYFVSRGKNPFLGRYCWLCPSALDFDAMNRAAELLLRTADFTSFAKLHSDAKTNICRVTHASWEPVPGLPCGDEAWVFTITADRFLRNMVRAVVGTLVDVGRGKLSLSDFADIIERRDRCAAGTSMPPQALFLWDITY